ncbi:MAG: hypothetical protein KIS76_14775 [Pyrinomonadaceae bacterium]|nr:hypothetical protein [Pyrinomonadaceae bacterium]
MEEFLKTLKEKEVDIAFGSGSSVRGEITDVRDGVLFLRDEEDRLAYVAIEKITVIWEVKDSLSRPGFLG